MCNQLEDTVKAVVNVFMDNETLFTALDVSNEVKKTMPQATHRSVRDIVRELYASLIEPAGWSRTAIDVTLEDGSTREALLYHPLSDSWDLDTKYDDQKRAQVSVKPVATPKPVNNDDVVVVQTTVFPPDVKPTAAATPVADPATVQDVPPTTTPVEDVHYLPVEDDTFDSFAEECKALAEDLYKSLGFNSQEEVKAEVKKVVEAAAAKMSDTVTKARNMLASFLPKK